MHRQKSDARSVTRPLKGDYVKRRHILAITPSPLALFVAAERTFSIALTTIHTIGHIPYGCADSGPYHSVANGRSFRACPKPHPAPGNPLCQT